MRRFLLKFIEVEGLFFLILSNKFNQYFNIFLKNTEKLFFIFIVNFIL